MRMLAKTVGDGINPLDYMLAVMRDQTAKTQRRDDMAKAAAPYIHPRLSQVDAKASLTAEGAITFQWLPPAE